MNQLRRRGLRVERLQNDADAPAQTEPNPESVTHPGDGVSDAAAETADPANVSLGIEELAEIAGRIASITKSQLPLLPGLLRSDGGAAFSFFASRSARALFAVGKGGTARNGIARGRCLASALSQRVDRGRRAQRAAG